MTTSSTSTGSFRTPADAVHATLSRHMLVDGFPVVFDFEKSHGTWLHDAATGDEYLDLFSFFASQPVGFNHPGTKDPGYLERLMTVAGSKPANSDIYTSAMADFVETFARIVPETHRRHLFFVEGGALAVENALKTAFDWKYRKNREKGGPDTENLQILHFNNAFHGRSGYTLSLTNTHDPRKYQYFPRFDWPRVDLPELRFPTDEEALEATRRAEAASLAEIKRVLHERRDLVAAIILETIQGEGGDNHVRPEFLRELRAIADEEEALLIYDEVQCGMGLTGTWWAWEQLGVAPDIFCFGKKSQVCGIASTTRVDEVDSVFEVSSRINSTWGGNLVDMVRSERYIQIIEEENVLGNVEAVGAQALADLRELATESGRIGNVRGRGLMIAFDLESAEAREQTRQRLMKNRVIMLSCGARSLRFRPVLDLTPEDARTAVERIRESL